MRTFFAKSASLGAACALSACGSAEGVVGPDEWPQFVSEWNSLSATQTPKSVLEEMTSELTFSGHTVLQIGSGADELTYFGSMTVTADFLNDTIDGSTGNFRRYSSIDAQTADGIPVTGTIALSGILDGSGLLGPIEGTAIGSIDETVTNGEFNGYFAGSDAQAVGLLISDRAVDLFGTGIGYQ